MHPITEILQYVLNHEALLYPLLALIIMIQAEIGILISLYLIRIDQAAWSSFIFVALLGITLEEIGLFFAGAYVGKTRLGQKILKKIPWNEKIHSFLHGNTCSSLLAAKSIWISRLVVFWMGHSGMRFSKFIKANIPSIFIWFVVLTSILYGLVAAFGIGNQDAILRRVEIALPVFFLVIISLQVLLRFGLKRFFSRRVIDTEEAH